MSTCYYLVDDDAREAFELGKGHWLAEGGGMAPYHVALRAYRRFGLVGHVMHLAWVAVIAYRVGVWEMGRDVSRLRVIGDDGDDVGLEYTVTGSRHGGDDGE